MALVYTEITEKEAMKRFINHIPTTVTFNSGRSFLIWGKDFPLESDIPADAKNKVTYAQRKKEFMDTISFMKKRGRMYEEFKYYKRELINTEEGAA